MQSTTTVQPQLEEIVRIAMVCMGNICRSPMAEHVLRAKLAAANLPAEVVSAGTGGWHAGEPADPRTEAVLREHGYTYEHTAQQIKRSWLDAFDLILVMDHDNLKNVLALANKSGQRAVVKLLRDFDPNSAPGSIVPDPYYGGPDEFEQTLKLIEAACDGVVNWLHETGLGTNRN